ncbi:TonB-dependent receptor [Thalassotalea atypica]|uniref:TonB-dependent receptor n=1 Tax=Thalassotalea atypica TaxID=2054316 RepID=UPI002574503F|nr:TonB-dependent receptor [Thalassotalea atypica]
MKLNVLTRSIKASLCLLPLTLPSTALAEDAVEGESAKLEVIQVTAQRRVQNSKEVPVSVSVMRDELLDASSAGGADIRFMSARIPSLKIESSFGRAFPRFYMRGLGNPDYDLNASQPVSLIYDDVVQENPLLKGFPVFDVESVEVLRGPQGTLFGRNTPAGLVKFTSKRPTQDTEGYFSTSYGSLDSITTEGALSGALTDTISARVSLSSQTRDDWIDNKAEGHEEEDVLGGYDDHAAKIQLLYQPNDNFSALFNYHYRDLNGTPTVNYASAIKPGTNELVDDFERDEIYHDAADRATQTVKVNGGSLTLEYVMQDYTLTSVTGYESVVAFSRADVDGGYNPEDGSDGLGKVNSFTVESADGIPEHSQITQEFRVASNELGRLDYQFGLFIFAEDVEIDSFNYNADGTVKRHLVQNQKTDAWALFASADYDLTERLNVTAGIRYSDDKKDFDAERIVWTDSYAQFEENVEDSAISWDLSASYKYSNDTNLYARLAKGFRAPSIQGRVIKGDAEPSVADSETIHSIEVGVKSDVLDGAGRVNFDIYYFQMNDQQVTAQSTFDESAQKELINLDKTIGYGSELDFQYAMTENVTVTAGISYNYTEIQDEDAAIAACSFCEINDPVDENGLVGVDGKSLPRAPEWIGNFTISYYADLGEGEFYAYTDWSYTSEVEFNLMGAEEMSQDAYLEGGLRMGYLWSSSYYDYEVATFARNITDETAIIGGLTINNLAAIVNEGRSLGAEFKMSF